MTRRWLIVAISAAVVIVCWLALAKYYNSHTQPTELPPLIPVGSSVPPAMLPRPAHVIFVIEENKAGTTIIGNSRAPYLNQLAKAGASFSKATGVAHPSQPNYLALFTGRTNADADTCPERDLPSSQPSLGGALLAARLSFAGYSEDLPRAGFAGCFSGTLNEGYAGSTRRGSISATFRRRTTFHFRRYPV